MRILHISSQTAWRGGEQQLAYLVDHSDERGHESYSLVPAKSELSRRLSGHIIEYKKRFNLQIGLVPKIMRIVKHKNIDLIHVHDSTSHTLIWMALKTGLKTPVVISRKVAFPVKKTSLYKYNHPGVSGIITVSMAINESLANVLNTPEKLAIIPDGIDLSKIKETIALDLLQLYDLPQDTRIIGNIAALSDSKDLLTWVESIHALDGLRGLDGLHFVLVGKDGDSAVAVRDLICSYQLEEKVTLTGFVDQPIAYLKAFDIYLNTSKIEGLGSSVLDAMAASIPIISTQAGGLSDIIHDEQTALAIPVGQASQIAKQIHRLIEDPTLQNTLIENADTFVQKFSVGNMVDKTIDLYHKVLKPK